MLRKLRPRSAYDICAAAALFLVLTGGTAFAVVASNQVNSASIIDGQVKSQDLAANSVRTGKVANGSLLAQDFKAGQLPRGSTGPKGDAGAKGPKGDTGAQGLKGDVGPQGLRGIRGSTGATGPSDAYALPNIGAGSRASAHLTGFTQTRIATLSLPAGQYLVDASVQAQSQDNDPQNFTCRIYVNYNNTLTNPIYTNAVGVPGHTGNTRIILQGTVYYTGPGFAVLECDTFDGFAFNWTLSAIKVDSIH
jgi:hypothetical protein